MTKSQKKIKWSDFWWSNTSTRTCALT